MTAATTTVEHPEMVEAFAHFFPPNPVKHGRVLGRDPETGRKKVTTNEGAPVTLQALASHLGAGSKVAGNPLGYLPGLENGTPVGALDLDEKDFPSECMEEALRAVLECCARLGLHAYPERSSSGKGWHVWLWSDEVLPWETIRDALRAIANRAGLPSIVETYPRGARGAAGPWIITPYARALSGQQGVRPRLGLTFLETDEGQPIPVDELSEWITPNSAAQLTALAGEVKPSPALPREPGEKKAGDLAPRAVPMLLQVARSKAPPARHDALAAFLNLGQRAGDLPGMVSGLKEAELWRVWCPDSSRTLEEWAAEVDRWAAQIEAGEGGNTRGLTYLREECGYEVPSLAKQGSSEQGENPEDGKEKRRPAGTRVLEYAQEDGAELWHDQAGNAYITATVKGHREHYRLPSRAARDYLQALYYDREKRALNGQAQKEALDLMQAIARREGEQHHTAVRLAHLNGFTYVDLGTPTWEAVEVGPGYWKVILPHECPVRFTRPAGFLPLPTPVQGGDLAELGEFLNTDRRGLLMVTAWLLGAASGMGPYPVLALGGEQGTGKSTAASVARNLLDPNQADRRRSPKEERDLFIAAQNGHVLSFDNLSSIPGWLSDALCVISTGGAFTARALYTDSEETILEAVRPVIVNGIPDLLARPDLAERALTVTLYRIPGERRSPEKVFWSRYERARPRLLGALLSALAHALRHLEGTELKEAPRLADFARLIVAAEGALPWEPGEFLSTYGEMQSEAAGTVLDGEPVAEALRSFMDDNGEWTGTVKKLLGLLGEREYTDTRPPQGWPRTPKALGDALRRLAPALSKTGYSVTPAGKSKGGIQYRLFKETEPKFSKFTTPTGAVPDGENMTEFQEERSSRAAANVHPPGQDVNISGMSVNITGNKVHPGNDVLHSTNGLDELDALSFHVLEDDPELMTPAAAVPEEVLTW